MKSEVPQEIINKLIELGGRGDLDAPDIASDFVQFRPDEHLCRIHWRTWNSACECLSIEEHISLLKALVMAMRYSGWDSGSVAPGIWVFKKLEERITNKKASEIANWVIKHSDNPWMPFGNQRDRVLFVTNQDIDISEERTGTMLLKLKLMDSTERAQREQAYHRLQQQQQAAKIKRLAKKKEESKNHIIRKNRQEHFRKELLAAGETLDAASRLRLIIQYQDLPVYSFPSTWANVSEAEIRGLDEETRKLLLKHIATPKNGPWRLLWEGLNSLA